jgi:hypothetical protein
MRYIGARGPAAGGSWEATVASIVWIAIGTAVAYGAVFGSFLAISFAIRREDKVGTLTGRAPSRACRSARQVAGFHRLR